MGITGKIKRRLKALLGIENTAPVTGYRLYGNASAIESKIGNYSYVSPNTLIHSTEIGMYCSIGPNCCIGYGDHPIHFISTSPMFYHASRMFDKTYADKEYYDHHRKVKIGNDVWIGANAVIRNGVEIGDGAIIGAGSVVLDNVPAYTIFAGVPAKFIKKRFSEELIAELVKSQWWNLPEETIIRNFAYFVTGDEAEIMKFIRSIQPSL